ncbi:phosphoglycerate kinase [Chloroflexota bacterium]
MFKKKTIRDINVSEKKIIVRVDFNVPISDGVVGDDTRIKAALPTILYLLAKNCKVILCSHLGRPGGKFVDKYSLEPLVPILSELLGKSVEFARDCVGTEPEGKVDLMKTGDILLLENTRFHAGETNNDPGMSGQLARLADIFVNDAFGSAHRAHSSTEGVARVLPSVAGFLMEKEILFLGSAVESPERPFVAILGGAKVSDKIGVIKNLLSKADQILIGGGMANTFFKSLGYPVGDSLFEESALDNAKGFLEAGKTKIMLPVDVMIADRFEEDAEWRLIPAGQIPDGWRILDIGPETVSSYKNIIQNSKTVVWNGPMGVFEFPQFSKGTFGVAKSIADSHAMSIIGGGESAAAIHQSGLASKITHISTGGGASLEMLAGKTLPGVAILLDK